MDAKLKQRVIGAIVLTALAIIVVPMVLDGSYEERQAVVATIPEAPSIELKKLRAEDVRRQMETMEKESAARLPQEVERKDDDPATAEASTPERLDDDEAFELDEDKLPVSWALQVASFRDRDKAVDLRASLRESDYRSYILQADTSDGHTYRVFVGPTVQKQKLRKISEQIESRFDLKGLIVRYHVEDDEGQLGG